MIEDLIKELIQALDRNTVAITKQRYSEDMEKHEEKFPPAESKVSNVVNKSENVSKKTPPPPSWAKVRREVIAWIGPLVKKDKKKGQDVMKKLLAKFANGMPLQEDNIEPGDYQNILDYIKETEAK